MSVAGIETPSRESVPGMYVSPNGQMSGYLTRANIRGVSDYIKSILTPDVTYTWVAVNEGFGWRPEVRTGQRVEPDKSTSGQGLVYNDEYGGDLDHKGFTVVDTYGVWGLSVTKSSEPKPGEPLPKYATHVAVEYKGGWQIEIHHRAPAGYEMWWTIAVEGQ